MKNVRAVIAEYERSKINERMIRGRKNEVKDGHVLVHSTPPYGYQVATVNGTTSLVPYEPEAQIVRRVFDLYVHGGVNGKRLSMQAITRKLTAMKVPTPLDTNPQGGGFKRRGCGEWCRATVGKIIGNEVYKGVWHYDKGGTDRNSWLAVPVQSIVDEDLWDAAQMRRRRNRDQARRNRKHRYLLTGRIRCGQCGTRMNGHPNAWRSKNASGLNLYYQCAAARNKEARADIMCNSPQYRVDEVDAAVWEYIKPLLLDPVALEEGLREQQAERERNSAPLPERLDVVADLLHQNRQQLERLLDLYLGGDFPQEMLTEREARLEETISALEQEQGELNAQLKFMTVSEERVASITEFARQVASGLDVAKADFAMRQRIIEELGVQVTMSTEDGQTVAYLSCYVGERHQWLESTPTRDRSVGG